MVLNDRNQFNSYSPIAAAMTKKNRGMAQNMACLWRDEKSMPDKWKMPRCELSKENRKAVFSVRLDSNMLLALPNCSLKDDIAVPTIFPFHIPFVTCTVRYFKSDDIFCVKIVAVSTTTFMEFPGRVNVRYFGTCESDGEERGYVGIVSVGFITNLQGYLGIEVFKSDDSDDSE